MRVAGPLTAVGSLTRAHPVANPRNPLGTDRLGRMFAGAVKSKPSELELDRSYAHSAKIIDTAKTTPSSNFMRIGTPG